MWYDQRPWIFQLGEVLQVNTAAWESHHWNVPHKHLYYLFVNMACTHATLIHSIHANAHTCRQLHAHKRTHTHSNHYVVVIYSPGGNKHADNIKQTTQYKPEVGGMLTCQMRYLPLANSCCSRSSSCHNLSSSHLCCSNNACRCNSSVASCAIFSLNNSCSATEWTHNTCKNYP